MKIEITLKKLSEILGGTLKGNPEYVVNNVSSPGNFSAGSIVPLWEKKFISKVAPGTVLLTKTGWITEGCMGIEVNDPRVSLTSVLEYFESFVPKTPKNFIHPTAVISQNAKISESAYIGPNCIVLDGATVGENVVLSGNVWVGSNVTIGDDTVMEPGVILYDGISIGKRCRLHANAIIGCDGFGFMPDAKMGVRRIPQIGTTIICDDVEIGCNTCIDKATFGETRIGRGCKIDALVKIGHNTVIGDFSIIVSQSGVAGSSTIGKGVTLAAQSGVGNHAVVGDRATVAGRAGVIGDIAPGATVSGFPAEDHAKDMKKLAALRHLPDMIKKVRELEARLKELEGKNE